MNEYGQPSRRGLRHGHDPFLLSGQHVTARREGSTQALLASGDLPNLLLTRASLDANAMAAWIKDADDPVQTDADRARVVDGLAANDDGLGKTLGASRTGPCTRRRSRSHGGLCWLGRRVLASMPVRVHVLCLIVISLCPEGCAPDRRGAAQPSSADASPEHDAGNRALDAGISHREAASDSGACFCCSGSRGAVASSDATDAGDCQWCPAYGTCVPFQGGVGGGAHPAAYPAYRCVVSVANGATVNPDEACSPVTGAP